VTTIGGGLEAKVRKLAEDGSLVHAYVLDAVGSIAAEEVAGHMEMVAADMARSDGLVASRRFSPGYCDWNITQQRSLFRLAEADSIGVSLSELGLMIPRKSVSGIIGLGPSGAGVETYNPCSDCAKKDCLGRRDR
jgi:cobalamin-dependent methionine synthase I